MSSMRLGLAAIDGMLRTNKSPLVRAFCLLSYCYALRSGSVFLASDWRLPS